MYIHIRCLGKRVCDNTEGEIVSCTNAAMPVCAPICAPVLHAREYRSDSESERKFHFDEGENIRTYSGVPGI